MNTCLESDHAQSPLYLFKFFPNKWCVLLTFLTSGVLQMFDSINVLFSKIFHWSDKHRPI